MAESLNTLATGFVESSNQMYQDAKSIADKAYTNPIPGIIIATMVTLIIFILFVVVSVNQPDIIHKAGGILAGMLISGMVWIIVQNKVDSVVFTLYNPKITATRMALGTLGALRYR